MAPVDNGERPDLARETDDGVERRAVGPCEQRAKGAGVHGRTTETVRARVSITIVARSRRSMPRKPETSTPPSRLLCVRSDVKVGLPVDSTERKRSLTPRTEDAPAGFPP